MGATTKKGHGPWAKFHPDGRPKTPEEIRKAIAANQLARYHARKKEGTLITKKTAKKAAKLNGDGVVGGKVRWTLVVRTGPALYRIFITGVGEFVAKKASIRI